MITVAIDFDDTITAIPEAVAVFVNALIDGGHRPIVVTRRYDTEENRKDLQSFLDEHAIKVACVVFAGQFAKQVAANQAGESVDIWMDDSPETIAPRAMRVLKRPLRR